MSALRVSLVPLSSCPAEGLVWRRAGGPWTLTVVVRATFVLRPGVSALSTVQHLPVAGPRGYSDGSTGVYAPTDLVPAKPRADVLVVGRPRSPVARVRIAIAELDKRGAGADVPAMGPVAAASTTRDWSGRILPVNLDPASFNVAPHDQQLAALRGDERILLEGLHPEHAELTTALPGLRAVAIAEAAGGPPRRVQMRADTLWFDASRGICAVVWRGQNAVDRDLRVLVDVDGSERAERAAPMAMSPKAALPLVSPVEPPPAYAPRAMAPMAQQAHSSPWARGGVATPIQPIQPIVALPSTPLAAEPARTEERPRDTLDLLWVDASTAARVRREPRFAAAFDAIDDRVADSASSSTHDEDELAGHEDRRDLFELVAIAEPEGEDGARRALDQALTTGASGAGVAEPVVLLAGELVIAFDPSDTLKAVCSAAGRLGGSDPATIALVTQARKLLQAPGAMYAPAAATAFADRIRVAAVASVPEKQRQAAAGELEDDVRRGLLDARSFAWRRALGARHARAVLRIGERRYDVFLCEDLCKALPRVERVRVRLLAMAHPHPAELAGGLATALRPLALAVISGSVQLR